jgi:hypothetical protein
LILSWQFIKFTSGEPGGCVITPVDRGIFGIKSVLQTVYEQIDILQGRIDRYGTCNYPKSGLSFRTLMAIMNRYTTQLSLHPAGEDEISRGGRSRTHLQGLLNRRLDLLVTLETALSTIDSAVRDAEVCHLVTTVFRDRREMP